MTVYEPPAVLARPITVQGLLDDPGLEIKARLVAGAGGLGREIKHPRIQKSGLAMVGHKVGIEPTRIQVMGETEWTYANGLDADEQRKAAANLFSLGLTCLMVTRGVEPPRAFVAEAERTGTPLIVCAERSSAAIMALHTLLDERLAPRTREHGVLVDCFEVGVLLLGASGIGKSETALELVMRGHRLVADDVVEFDYRPPGMVFGEPAALLKHHIEVRGLGILNIKDLYGVTSVRDRKRLDLIVRLEFWSEGVEYDRIGVEDAHREILGVPVREVVLPVRPGRNMSSIIEIAARNELLRREGHHSARAFVQQVEAGIERGEGDQRLVERLPFKPTNVPESQAPAPYGLKK